VVTVKTIIVILLATLGVVPGNLRYIYVISCVCNTDYTEYSLEWFLTSILGTRFIKSFLKLICCTWNPVGKLKKLLPFST
jgi:hypothetical protein